MARKPPPQEKPLHWVGSAKKNLLAFPEVVIDEIGYALGLVQLGGRPPAAKPWKGEGPGVFELVEDHRGDTWRVVYTVRFENAVYVLHCFQKKSPSGVRTAQQDVQLIRERLKTARRDYEERYGKESGKGQNEKRESVDAGSGNVFADLGFADAGERKLRVQLAMQLNELIGEHGLTQAKAAALFGVPQPHVSELKNYKLTRFSSERLMRFLTLLDRDVEIVIRPKAKGRSSGLVSVSTV